MKRTCLVLVSLAACHRGAPQQAPASGEPVVARVGTATITARDLSAQLARQPPAVRAHYGSLARRKDFLDNQIRFELLAEEARKRGYDKDPDFTRSVKQQLVSTFLQKEMEARLKPGDIPDAEVEAYYKEHTAEFNQPEMVRVSQIVVKDKRKARDLLAKVKALKPEDSAGFAKLVGESSEDAESKSRGGDLGLFAREGSPYPKPVIDAAFALQKPGEVAGPVASDRGLHILRLIQRRPGSSRTFGEAKNEIRQRLYQQQRAKRMEELMASIKQSTKVEIFEPELAKVAVDPGRAAAN
jgi:peptidyl-prolyl cis-trans isomerase C